jgi:hypothetical protein
MIFVNMNMPAVVCKETGKTYILGWEDIIKLAMQAGVGV